MNIKKRICLLICFMTLSLFVFGFSLSQESQVWTNLDLYGGQINKIAIDPNNPDKMFAASYGGGGLYLSEDGGSSWQGVETAELYNGSDSFRNHAVWTVEIAPSDSNVVWAGHNEWVEKSVDGGKTWTHILNIDMQTNCRNCGGNEDDERYPKSIAIDPANPQIVYVGTSGPKPYYNEWGAIYKTMDGGQTWTKINGGSNFDYEVLDVAVDHLSGNIVWAVTSSNGLNNTNSWFGTLYRSEDNGDTWESIHSFPFGAFTSVAPKPDNSNIVFTTSGWGVIKHEYVGSEWQNSTNLGYASNVDFAPGSADIVYVTWTIPDFYGGDGLPRISRSNDGGDTWETTVVDNNLLTGFLTFAVHPDDSSIVFCGDTGMGVFKTADQGQTWTLLNQGIASVIIYDFAIDPTDSTHMIAGTASGLYEKIGDNAWQRRLKGLIKSVRFHPSLGSEYYAGLTGYLAKTKNSGTDWTFNLDSLGLNFVYHIEIDSENTDTIFIAAGNTVQKSTDGGVTFVEKLGDQFEHAYRMNVVVIDPTNHQHLFAGGGNFYNPEVLGDLWESTDSGETWTLTGLTDVIVNDLLIDPANPRVLYAGCGHSANYSVPLWKSTDAGATWKAFEEGMPRKSIRLIDISGLSSDNVFAVGWDGTVLHFNGLNWTAMDTSSIIDHTEHISLQGIFGASQEDVFAVGDHGTVIHYNGSTWSAMDSTTEKVLYHVWGDSRNNMIAVGEDGTTLKYNGTNWSAMDVVTDKHLYRIFWISSSDLFVVGEEGIIIHYNGSTWSIMDSGTDKDLFGIWGNSNNSIIAVGEEGTIIKYNGSSWTSMNSPTTNNITGVWGTAEDDVYAVGFGGIFLKYNGTEWTKSSIEDAYICEKIWGTSSSDLFVSGYNSGIFHFNGSSWSTHREPGTNKRTVTDLEFHKQNKNIIYAGTWNAGIYISPNQAGNWLNLGTPKNSVHAISAGSLYAATEGALLQCTGTGVIAGQVTDVADNMDINGATVVTDFGTTCITINGEYMMVSPAGIFDVFAVADDYEVKIENDITVYGSDVAWVNFQLPIGVPDVLQTSMSGNQDFEGRDYCFIATAEDSLSLKTERSRRENLAGFLFFVCISAFSLFIYIRHKRFSVMLLPGALFLVSSALDVHAFNNPIQISSPPVLVGSGARALGMGGTFIGIADDATAASWNPAGLIQLEKPEVSIVSAGFRMSEQFSSDLLPEIANTGEADDNNINYFSATYPFYFHRNMVVSINYQRLYELKRGFSFIRDFSDAELDLIEETSFSQEGYMGALGFAGAVEITPSLSLGATLNIWTDQLFWRNGWNETYVVHASGTQSGVPVTIDTLIQDEFDYFRGININLGLLWDSGRYGTLGVVVKTPFTATLARRLTYEETTVYSEPVDRTIPTLLGPFIDEIKLDMPISYGMGWSLRYSDALTMGVDIYRTHWEQYILTDSQGNEESPIDGRPKNESNVNATMNVRCGGEYLVVIPEKRLVVPVRAGIFFDPEPSEGKQRDFYGIAVGSGVTYKKYVFDLAYQLRWGRNVDTGNLIATSEADIMRHTIIASLIVHL